MGLNPAQGSPAFSWLTGLSASLCFALRVVTCTCTSIPMPTTFVTAAYGTSFIFHTWLSLLTTQQQKIYHLLLIMSGEREGNRGARGRGREGGVGGREGEREDSPHCLYTVRQVLSDSTTYSGLRRARCRAVLSLKQPREAILLNTSGSMSVRESRGTVCTASLIGATGSSSVYS